MGYYTFGGGAAEVATDTTGKVLGGVQYQVWSKFTGGMQISDLQSVDGTALPGYVTSEATPDNPDDLGRISFLAPDDYPVVYLDRGYGDRWAIMAREVWTQVGTAIDAYGAATAASEQASDDVAALSSTVGVLQDTVDNSTVFGFDITQLSAEYVAQMRISPGKVMQSFEKDPITGQFYVAQNQVVDGQSYTDLVIYRCSPAGDVIDQSTLSGGGHGSSISLENVGSDVYVWTWWSKDTTGTNPGGPVRWKYSGGKTVLRTDADVHGLDGFESGYSCYSIDQANDRLAVRTGSAGQETFVLRKLSDYKNTVDNPLYTVNTDMSALGAFQGFATIDGYVYVNRGGTGEDDEGNVYAPTITRIDWTTGGETTVDVTGVGAAPDGTFVGNHNEIEGAAVWRSASGKPSLMFGKVTGAARARRSSVFVLSPVGADDLASATLRSLSERVQVGRVLITPVPNQSTTVHVDFPHEFPGTPIGFASVRSSVVGDTVKGVSASKETSTGMDVTLYRTNDTETGVNWQAILP